MASSSSSSSSSSLGCDSSQNDSSSSIGSSLSSTSDLEPQHEVILHGNSHAESYHKRCTSRQSRRSNMISTVSIDMSQLQIEPPQQEEPSAPPAEFNIGDHYPSIEEDEDATPLGLVIGGGIISCSRSVDEHDDIECQLGGVAAEDELRTWGKKASQLSRSQSITLTVDSDSLRSDSIQGTNWWWCFCCWITPRMRKQFWVGAVIVTITLIGTVVGVSMKRTKGSSPSAISSLNFGEPNIFEVSTVSPSAPPIIKTTAPTEAKFQITSEPSASPVASTSSPVETPSSSPSSAPSSSPSSAPSSGPSSAPSSAPSNGPTVASIDDENEQQSGSNGGSNRIIPVQTIGAYYKTYKNASMVYQNHSSALDGSIEQDLAWSRASKIGLWIMDYDIDTEGADTEPVWSHPDLGSHKLAWRLQIQNENVTELMSRMCDTYFPNANYHRIFGKALVVVAASNYTSELRDAAIEACQEELFVVGNLADDVDAVADWDVANGLVSESASYNGTELDLATIDSYYENQVQKSDLPYVPSVTPGFANKDASNPLPRQLNDGTYLMEYSLLRAVPLVDTRASNLLLVNSFNNWSEGTHILPSDGTDNDVYGDLLRSYTFTGFMRNP